MMGVRPGFEGLSASIRWKKFLRWHRLVSNLAQRQKSKVTPARAPESARAFAGLRLRRHLSFDAHHGADADAERLGNLVQTVALA
jgi:hypothetical protein